VIVTKPRDWARIKANLESIDAKSVFLMGCGQCATVAHTGGEKELAVAKGVQTVADAVKKPVFPGLESAFLGTVLRSGVYEERCQTCGDCVLDLTAGICPVTTCPKGLLNGPCGGMWNGMCEVQTDRECTHVRIKRRLAEQGRSATRVIPAKDNSVKLKPGSINTRERKGQ
jgi:ferredoxin